MNRDQIYKILDELKSVKFTIPKNHAPDKTFEKWVLNHLVDRTKFPLDKLTEAEHIISIGKQLEYDWKFEYSIKNNTKSFISYQPFGKSAHPDILVVNKDQVVAIECKYSANTKAARPSFGRTVPKGGIRLMFYNGKRGELMITQGRDITHPLKDSDFLLLQARGADKETLKEYLKTKTYYYGNQKVGYNAEFVLRLDLNTEIRKYKVE